MINFIEICDEISLKKNNISKNLNDIKENDNHIELKLKSIKLEGVLNSFPSNAIETINFKNILNEKYDFYDTFQFNKIIRFVVFVETIEKEYFNLVGKSKKEYITNPGSDVFVNLIDKYNFLSLNYQLLKILTDEVDGDKLMFNKVFNELEDQGMFLTKIETFNIKTYSSINESLDSVVNLLGEVSSDIRDISYEVSMTNHVLEDINSKVWNIENNTNTN